MRILFYLVVGLIPFMVKGQSSMLPALMAGTPSQFIEKSNRQIDEFVSEVRVHAKRNDAALLKQVFVRTHKHFLKQYVAYSQFGEIFESGKYDCLTATSLFALVLDDFGFSYRIVETNYHIFILVQTSQGEVLLETTDRLNGFVRNEQEIQMRLNSYRRNLPSTEQDGNVYHYRFALFDEVATNQLPGLLYFNQAVKAYNEDRLEKCADYLILAESIYHTPRISEFGKIFLRAVAVSDLNESAKQQIIRRLSSGKNTILASR